MKLDEIFTLRGYDMVVAIKITAINEQLKKLCDDGFFQSKLMMEMGADETDDDAWKPIFVKDWDKEVSKDIHGKPYNPCINATVIPTLEVLGSGNQIQLGATFTSGYVFVRDIANGRMKGPYDVTGWSFGAQIRVDFAEWQLAPDKDHPIPPVVLEHLESFSSDRFAVSRLFCDLTGVDWIGKALDTHTGNADFVVKTNFMVFMTYHMEYIKTHPEVNPYILGYQVRHKPTSDASQDEGVPDSLKPIGNSFNIFNDTRDHTMSTLNFILNTQISHLTPGNHPATDSFDRNWLSPGDVGQGKMIYSFRAFLETMIIRPFYEAYAPDMYRQVTQGGVENLIPDADYEHAKAPRPDGRPGYQFTIHNQPDGMNRYVNKFDVTWSSTSTGVTVRFHGNVYWYHEKEKHIDLGIKKELARAWAEGGAEWEAVVDIGLNPESDGQGHVRPVLKFNSTFTPKGSYSRKDQNDVSSNLAKLNDLIGDFIKFSTVFLMFADPSWLTTSLVGAFFLKLPEIKPVKGFNLDVSLKQISRSVPAKIILPAGDVFEFKNVAASDEGHVSMMLDYLREKVN